jgi:lipopolysaccharide export system protein LptA
MTYYTDRKVAYYDERALLKSSDSELRSQRGYYDMNSKNAYFYGNVTAVNPDFFLKSDSLIFNTEMERAFFIAPTIINQGASKIYCESGYYDIDDKEAKFADNAQYKKEDEISTADTIFYSSINDKITLTGNAIYRKTNEYAKAEIIDYDQKNDIISLTGDAYYENETSKVKGEKIVYNKVTDRFITKGRSSVSDKGSILEAEDIDYDKKTGNGIAIGDVIFKDTINNSSIYCDTLLLTKNDSLESSKAIGFNLKPQIISIDDDNDTLFISADTLYSYKIVKQLDSLTLDTIQYMLGDNDVKIFKSDFQAVADSLIYNDKDSLFTLFDKPIVWSDSTQIFGDTIEMYLKNKKIDRMHFIQKAMIVNTSDMIYFTQIQGKTIFADFLDNKINKMKVQGNARSLYYMQDEAKAYVGVNKTDCSLIIFNFSENEIQNIRFYINPISEALPMKNTNHESLKLDGFKWYGERRPLLNQIRTFKIFAEPLAPEPTLENIELLDSVQEKIEIPSADLSEK